MQIFTYGWTNPATAVAKNINMGFQPSSITTTNVTDGKQYYWDENMTDGYYVTVDTGAVTTSNGFTPLNQSGSLGSAVSGFTNANPGVITVADASIFTAGDSIIVTQLADDQSAATSLNGTFEVASVTATTITLVENTTAYSVYVSGGVAIPKSDSAGDPISAANRAVQGVTLGTGVVGGNTDVMTLVAYGADPVT
jgi:hypothetical protein